MSMAIETKLLSGDGAVGSKLEIEITEPELTTKNGWISYATSMNPVEVEGRDGLYLFNVWSTDGHETTGQVDRIVATGRRVG